MIDLSIAKAGDIFVTKNGTEVEFIGYSDRKLHYLCLLPNTNGLFYTSSGYCFANNTEYDIASKQPTIIKGYINIYTNQGLINLGGLKFATGIKIYKTEQDAHNAANCTTYHKTIAIEFIE